MNAEVKKLWIDALRSGEYKQTKAHLRTENGYCCLGVLCELYAADETHEFDWKEEKGFSDESDPITVFSIHGFTDLLPDEVINWAGMETIPASFLSGAFNALANLNDEENYKFDQIADVIEKNFKTGEKPDYGHKRKINLD